MKIMINIFKADKYKVICAANNLEQLNLLHDCDYSLYKHNIILNSISKIHFLFFIIKFNKYD